MADGKSAPPKYSQPKQSQALARFNEVVKVSNELNQRGLELARRVGFGTFVASEDGRKTMDYCEWAGQRSSRRSAGQEAHVGTVRRLLPDRLGPLVPLLQEPQRVRRGGAGPRGAPAAARQAAAGRCGPLLLTRPS